MDVVVLISAVLTILALLITLCSCTLHFKHHFECHEYFKIECCCTSSDGNRTISSRDRYSLPALQPTIASRGTARSRDAEAWSNGNLMRRVSHRTSVVTSAVVEEVKRNNCCCCDIVERNNYNKDRICCCLFSSVEHMEFYPFAVAILFILFIVAILYISSFTILFGDFGFELDTIGEQRFDVQYVDIANYCTALPTQFDSIRKLQFFYATSPISHTAELVATQPFVSVRYVVLIMLILWESLLNWYRFYSTKFMSIKFIQPPYSKIFGFYSIYAISFACICVAQLYVVYVLFVFLVALHVCFNVYCFYGFISVLHTQYQHYVKGSNGVSELIINELRHTIIKLKICASLCIITSTVFVLTFTMCNHSEMLLAVTPLWWSINSICWMLTFAKNSMWCKQVTTCKRQQRCCKRKHAQTARGDVADSHRQRKNQNETQMASTNKLTAVVKQKSLATVKEETDQDLAMQVIDPDEPTPLKQAITMTSNNETCTNETSPDEILPSRQPTITAKRSDTFSLNVAPFAPMANPGVDGIQLPTILDDKALQKNSPQSMSKNPVIRSKRESNIATPLSTLITPAGQAPKTRDQPRDQSVTYQYPADFEDPRDDLDHDDYFTFPVAGDIHTHKKHPNGDDGDDEQRRHHNDEEQEEKAAVGREEEHSHSHTPSITMTMSKKPKALELLGVTEHEESTKQKRVLFKIDLVEVADTSTPDVLGGRSQSARSSKYNVRKHMAFSEDAKQRENNEHDYDNEEEEEMVLSQHDRRGSRTMTFEPSHNIWELMVHDGFMSSQTIRSLHELEEYTMAAKEQSVEQHEFPGFPRQRSSHL